MTRISKLVTVIVLCAWSVPLAYAQEQGSPPDSQASAPGESDPAGAASDGQGEPADDAGAPDQAGDATDAADGTQADGTQADGTQADGTQADGTQADGAQADGAGQTGETAQDGTGGSADPPQPSATRGVVTGTVIDQQTGEPVAFATVTIVGLNAAAFTNDAGVFTIENVPPGRYQVTAVIGSSEPITSEVEVIAGQTATLQLAVASGETIVVTGSILPESPIDMPTTVAAVSSDTIDKLGAGGPMEAAREVPGIDFASVGLSDQRISVRGFTTQFNSRFLSMTDGRLATLPGAGIPQGNLMPTSRLDMKAVEVIIGPASALYGANAHTGVINVLSKTPWDESGARLELRGGMQGLLDGAVRLAGTVDNRFGWKVNAQLFRGREYEPDPNVLTHYYGSSVFEKEVVEDYDISAVKADATAYYRITDDWLAKGVFGYSVTDGFGLTNAGRNRLRGFEVQYQSAQIASSNVSVQFTRTATDAGETYALNSAAGAIDAIAADDRTPEALAMVREATRFVDKSSMLDAEAKYFNTFGPVRATVGAQWRSYMPSSEGTYLADATGEDIDATELGGFGQVDYNVLNDRLRFVGAARVDNHSNYSTQLSPKAAVVFEIAPQHNVRLVYNRAFKSPTILENYLFLNIFLLGNRDGFTIRDADNNIVSEIDPLEPEQVNSFELGYRGVINDQVAIDIVAYNSYYENFISPLTAVSNPGDPDNPTFGHTADGTRVGVGTPIEGTPLEGALFTYLNFGEAQVLGADAGVSVFPNQYVTLTGSVSVLRLQDSDNSDAPQAQLLLNVPTLKLKGSVQVKDLGADNYYVRLGARYGNEYEFESGYWSATAFFPNNDNKIPARFVTDLSAGYLFPKYGISVAAFVQNALGSEDIDILGAPPAGRLAYLQMGYQFDGMNF